MCGRYKDLRAAKLYWYDQIVGGVDVWLLACYGCVYAMPLDAERGVLRELAGYGDCTTADTCRWKNWLRPENEDIVHEVRLSSRACRHTNNDACMIV